MCSVLKEDFKRIISDYDFSVLKEKSIFVTGSTGLLGSQLVKFFCYLNDVCDYNIKIYALARNIEKVIKVYGRLHQSEYIHFLYGDVLKLPKIDFDIDYIIHGASITSSQDFIVYAVETIDTAVNGTLNLLRLAKERNVKSFVYLSSIEAFGIVTSNNIIREDDLGYIDVSSPRSSYMESKRMCENICACFASEYGVPVKSIRLTQVIGVGIDYYDTRVAAYFARSVVEGTDIVLKTEGKTKRPVLYSSDAITAILTVLLKGMAGNVYTAANPKTFVTIRETAEMIVNKIANNSIKVILDLKEVPAEYAPNLNLNLNLNVDKLCSLGWHPSVDLQTSYKRLIKSMECTIK